MNSLGPLLENRAVGAWQIVPNISRYIIRHGNCRLASLHIKDTVLSPLASACYRLSTGRLDRVMKVFQSSN